MSDIRNIIEEYRNDAMLYAQQAAMWRQIATTLALREDDAAGTPIMLTKVAMTDASIWVLEPKQLKTGAVKLTLSLVPVQPEVDDGVS